MHYYKRNIGDYAKKAGRLGMLEHGAYTTLIDACYDREKFPTLDEAIDWCWASTHEEIEAIKFVLFKFFDEVDGVFIQSRIQEEIDKYHENAAINKRIAQEREAKKKAKGTKRARNVNEPPPNQEPLTTNHKPLTKDQKKGFAPPSVSEVKQYCDERNNNVNPNTFVDFYEAKGWMVGKNKMKSWKACVRTWEKRDETGRQGQNTGFDNRSRAKKVSDKLDELAAKAIANGEPI